MKSCAVPGRSSRHYRLPLAAHHTHCCGLMTQDRSEEDDSVAESVRSAVA